MSKEIWDEVDLETGEVKRPDVVLPIPERGCEDCKRFFGWAIHRQYKKGLDIFHSDGLWVVGYWNEDRSMFTVLGWFDGNHQNAIWAWEHIQRAT